jgi:hypothetical protein
VTRLRRFAGDPFAVSVAVLGALVVAGFVGVAVGWKGAAASLDVAVQLPYVVSGAVAGLATIGLAAGLLLVQARRRDEALERAEMDRLVRAAADLLAAVRSER